MTDIQAEARATVEREAAEWRAVQEQLHQAVDRPRRRPSGSSVVFSVRLDPLELAALERRAAEREIAPSVLARNLIRTGLRTTNRAALSRAVDHLEDVVAQLRAAVS
jgi:hypothetical protein